MKVTILTLIVILLTSCMFAQEIAIRQASNIQWKSLHIQGTDNQSFVIWEDADSGHTEVMVQKLNSSGELMWANPLSFGTPGIYNYAIEAVRSSDNANLVLYCSGDDSGRTYYLVKFNDNGSLLWTGDPVVVISGNFPYPSVSMTANNTGGAYIVYTTDFSVNNIRGVNIDGNGNHLWNPGGQVLASFAEEARVVSTHPDGQGGVIVNCYLLNDIWESSTHLVRFSAAAEVVGTNPLVPTGSFSMILKNTLTTTDGNLLLYSTGGDIPTLSMQKIDMLGNPIGTTVSYSMQNTDEVKQLVLSPSPSGGVMAAWRYYDETVLFTRCQSFNSSLQALWNASGVLINYPSFDLYDLGLIPDQFGGTWLHSMQKIYYVNSEGVSVFGEEGLVYSQYSYQKPLLISTGSSLTILWRQELNRSLSLQRQVFDQNGTPVFPAGGSPIIDHLAGFAAYSQSFALDNNYIVTWHDSRIGGKDTKICYQLVSPTGQTLLEENGRELNPASDAPEWIIASKTLDNDKLAVLYSQSGYPGSIFLQVIDSSGTKLIDGNGLSMSVAGASGIKMDCYQGDIYIAWMNSFEGERLMGQRISNLQKQWGENGMILIEFPQTASAYVTDLCGRYFLFILRDYNTYVFTSRAVLVDTSGALMPGWGPWGLQQVILTDTSTQYNRKSALMQDDLITLTENHYYSNITYHAQRMSAEGIRIWSDSGVQVAANQLQFTPSDIVVDDNISFLYKSGDGFPVLAYQRISGDGSALYTNGADVSDNTYEFISYGLVGFDNGTQVAVFDSPGNQESYYGFYTDIMARYISTNGEPSYLTQQICEAPYEQNNVSLASLGTNALASWTDFRVGYYSEDYAYSSIFGRILSSGSTSSEDPVTPSLPVAVLHQNYPNPFNPSTTIRFSLSEQSPVNLDIYNLRGQLIQSLCRDQVFGSGLNEIVWDGLDSRGASVSSGVYFYRLRVGNQAIIKKMVLSK